MSIISKGTKILKKLPKIKKNTFKNNNKKKQEEMGYKWLLRIFELRIQLPYQEMN